MSPIGLTPNQRRLLKKFLKARAKRHRAKAEGLVMDVTRCKDSMQVVELLAKAAYHEQRAKELDPDGQ
jgi:hypothetical protein